MATRKKLFFVLLFVFVSMFNFTMAHAVLNASNTRFYFSFDNFSRIGSSYVNDADNGLANGTIVGTVTVSNTGILYQSANFTGSGRVTVPNTTIQVQTSNMRASWGGWYRVSSFASRNWLMGSEVSGQTGGHGIVVETSGTTSCYVAGGSGTDLVSIIINTTPNIWRHVVCVHNGTHLLAYHNGVLNASAPTSRTLTVVAATYPIGSRVLPTETYDNPFNGLLDEVFYSNVSLTASQIATLYTNGTGLNPSLKNATITARDTITKNQLLNITADLTSGPTTLNMSSINGSIILPFNVSDQRQWNITVSSTDAGGYFSRSFINYNFSFSGNLNAELHQAVAQFKATEIFTGNQISNFNVSIFGFSGNDTSIFNITSGSVSVSFNKSGYFATARNFTISPLSVQNYTIENISNVRLNISVLSAFTNQPLNANITILPLSYAAPAITTQNVNVSTADLLNGSYMLTVSAQGFITNITTFNFTAGLPNVTFRLFPSNSFQVRFFDEQTLFTINTVQWTLTGGSLGSLGLNGTSSIGQINLSNLPSGVFELRYQPSGYFPRSYYISVPATSNADVNLSLYSISNTSGIPFIVTVTDKYNRVIDGATLSLMRRYVINNQTTFLVVEQSKPVKSANGQAVVYAAPNTVPYIFRVTDQSGFVLYQGSAMTASNYETIYLISQNLFVRVGDRNSIFQRILGVNNASVQLYNVTSPSSNTFWLSYQDRPPQFQQTCLLVVKNSKTVIHNACYQQQSAVVSYTVTAPEQGATYTANAIFKDDTGEDFIVATDSVSYDENPVQVWGFLGVAVLILTVLVFAFVFSDSPHMIVISSVLAVAAWGTSFIPIAAVSTITQGTLLVVAFVLMLLMRDR